MEILSFFQSPTNTPAYSGLAAPCCSTLPSFDGPFVSFDAFALNTQALSLPHTELTALDLLSHAQA